MTQEERSGRGHNESTKDVSDQKKGYKQEKEVKHSKAGLWISLVLLLLVASASAFFIPWKTVSRTEVINYPGVEEYTIREPYNITSKYSVPGFIIPQYSLEVDYKPIENDMAIVGCNITNEEAVPVRYRYYIYTTDKDETNTPDGTTSFSQSTVPAYVTTEGYGSIYKNTTLPAKEFFGCYVLPDLVERAYPTVKYQNTINYRNVTKIREVTKYRNETVYTQVNWILGTQMPWQKEWRG